MKVNTQGLMQVSIDYTKGWCCLHIQIIELNSNILYCKDKKILYCIIQ